MQVAICQLFEKMATKCTDDVLSFEIYIHIFVDAHSLLGYEYL